MGDEQLRELALEIADKVRANATIDWTIRESARAKLMVLVRRTLNKYGYPPDKQEKAIDTVMKQAELIANFWTSYKCNILLNNKNKQKKKHKFSFHFDRTYI